MKNNILIFTLLFFSLGVFAQDKKLAWDYPVKPGTEEWKKFDSNSAMVNACQIPIEILPSLSTEDLTRLCLQYPLLYDVFAFSNFNEGLLKFYDDFNGIRELYNRKNASKELLKQLDLKLNDFNFLDSNASDTEKGLFIISVSSMEVLLSHYTMRKELTNETSKEILKNLVNVNEKKNNYAEYFMGFGFRTNCYSRIQVISKIDRSALGKLPQKEKNTALFSGMADVHTISVINELSYQLIN